MTNTSFLARHKPLVVTVTKFDRNIEAFEEEYYLISESDGRDYYMKVSEFEKNFEYIHDVEKSDD